MEEEADGSKNADSEERAFTGKERALCEGEWPEQRPGVGNLHRVFREQQLNYDGLIVKPKNQKTKKQKTLKENWL